MPIKQSIKELLSSHDYLIKVRQDDKFDSETAISRCIATFPDAEGTAKQEKVYEILLEGGITVDGEQWLCPAYAARSFIEFDILYEAKKRSIHPDLVNYYNIDGEEVNNISEVMRLTPAGDVEEEDFLFEMRSEYPYNFGQRVLRTLFERTAQP